MEYKLIGYCDLCGNQFIITDDDIAHHIIDNEIDYDEDENHVPYQRGLQ
jgi:hypothetical protein